MNNLNYLESEAIHIIREMISESENPVMLYSIGKDSAVMLHLINILSLFSYISIIAY